MLARSSRGERVKELQLILITQGYFPGPPSGFYDARTEESVMLFQKEHNLTISGTVNRETECLIYKLQKNV